MKSLIFIFLLFQLTFISWAQTTWTDGRFSNTLDIGSIRNSSTHSNVGLSIHRNYNTSFQFAELGHSASHGILFSAYMNSSVSGSLSVTGNTKYYHGPSQYGGGAGAIMFFGNGGTMDFLISPQSTGSNQDIIWGTPKMRIKRDGNVGIGTPTPSEKLEVNGTIRTKEVKVESTPWPDYVFSDTYQLSPLSEVSTYIQENHHLPGIPTAEEVAENGIKLGEMNAKLLEKVEELTLYLIEHQEQILNQNDHIKKLQAEVESLKSNLK